MLEKVGYKGKRKRVDLSLLQIGLNPNQTFIIDEAYLYTDLRASPGAIRLFRTFIAQYRSGPELPFTDEDRFNVLVEKLSRLPDKYDTKF